MEKQSVCLERETPSAGMGLEIKRVPFLGTELMAARDNDGQIWAGVNWMCSGLGLSKGQMQRERLRIKDDKVLSKGERNLVLPTNGGEQAVSCLKLEFVPLWLAKINVTPTALSGLFS